MTSGVVKYSGSPAFAGFDAGILFAHRDDPPKCAPPNRTLMISVRGNVTVTGAVINSSRSAFHLIANLGLTFLPSNNPLLRGYQKEA